MDRKTLNIVLGAALLGSFFLAYFSMFGRSITGFEMVKADNGDWQKYLLLIIPISGLLLLVGALNNGNSILPGSLLYILPLLTLLYIMIVGPLINGMSFEMIFKTLGKGFGIGLWIAIAASLVLAIYRPRPR